MFRNLLILLFISTLFLTLAFESLSAQETIYLTNGEWPPYYGESLPGYGFDSQIVSEAFDLVGVKVIYHFFPWARALRNAAANELYAGGVGWGSGPEYEKDFYISDPTSAYHMVFFHRKDRDFQWDSDYTALEGMCIGLTLDYTYPDALMDKVEEGSVKAEWEPQDIRNFRKLYAGRIDLYPDDLLVGMTVMKRIFSPEEMARLTYSSSEINKEALHLVLTRRDKENRELILLFNEGLRRLKESGRYDQIIDTHLKGLSTAPISVE